MQILRSAAAIVLGFVLAAALDTAFVYLAWARPGPDRVPYPGLAGFVWLGLAGLVTGSLTGFVAGRRSAVHAGVVALLIAGVAAASLGSDRTAEPAWYRVLVVVVMGPALVAGGASYARRLRRRLYQAAAQPAERGPAERPGPAA